MKNNSWSIFVKKFAAKHGIRLRYSYNNKDQNKFFLEKNENEKFVDSLKELVKNKLHGHCKTLKWFKEIRTVDNKIFWKTQFLKYIDNNLSLKKKLSTIIPKALPGQIILGPSEITYPFVQKGYKALSISNLIHTEILNLFYLYCIVHQLLKNNIPIILCFSNKKNIGKVNNVDKKTENIRYFTKEIYTLIEIFKLLDIENKIIIRRTMKIQHKRNLIFDVYQILLR